MAPRRVLLATSNGTGLGHLNRAMAVARRLPPGLETSILTLSQAAPVVVGAGFEVDYLSSYRRPASGTDHAWNLRLRDVLAELIDDRRPDVVVFDGVHPYRALTHVLSARGAPRSIWLRRPMWRVGSSPAPLRRVGAFDAVLEPGELAAAADRGPTVSERGRAVRVDPIVFLDPSELLDRREAAAALGLDPARRTALVMLGQGGEVDRAVARTLAALAANQDLQVAALQSSIGSGIAVPEGVVRLDATFPMSRYFKAFDLAVAAPGYNAFHELIAFGVPALFVPMDRNTDDQHARSSWAADDGVALAVNGAADRDLEERVAELAVPEVAARLRERALAAFPGNGAAHAADLITRVAAGQACAPQVRDRGPFNRWLRLAAHRVGPSTPLVAAIGARDLLRNPERRRPYLLILALGVPDAEVTERVRRAIVAGRVPPERVLVVTDSLRFAELRALGVGFELLQTPAHPDGRLTGPELQRMRRRVQLLTAGRRPLRAISLGAHGSELLGLPN